MSKIDDINNLILENKLFGEISTKKLVMDIILLENYIDIE